MKFFQGIGLSFAVVLIAACDQQDAKSEAKTEEVATTPQQKLTPAQLKETIAGEESFFFLDVRSAEEIAELGTLKGYVNIPIDELEKRLDEIPKDIPVVTA